MEFKMRHNDCSYKLVWRVISPEGRYFSVASLDRFSITHFTDKDNIEDAYTFKSADEANAAITGMKLAGYFSEPGFIGLSSGVTGTSLLIMNLMHKIKAIFCSMIEGNLFGHVAGGLIMFDKVDKNGDQVTIKGTLGRYDHIGFLSASDTEEEKHKEAV
jgi:hypothetical protein